MWCFFFTIFPCVFFVCGAQILHFSTRVWAIAYIYISYGYVCICSSLYSFGIFHAISPGYVIVCIIWNGMIGRWKKTKCIYMCVNSTRVSVWAVSTFIPILNAWYFKLLLFLTLAHLVRYVCNNLWDEMQLHSFFSSILIFFSYSFFPSFFCEGESFVVLLFSSCTSRVFFRGFFIRVCVCIYAIFFWWCLHFLRFAWREKLYET